MPRIHPTAIVDPGARLDDDVEVGAYSIVESDVAIGAAVGADYPDELLHEMTLLGLNVEEVHLVPHLEKLRGPTGID